MGAGGFHLDAAIQRAMPDLGGDGDVRQLKLPGAQHPQIIVNDYPGALEPALA